jgi:hypothetical protein
MKPKNKAVVDKINKLLVKGKLSRISIEGFIIPVLKASKNSFYDENKETIDTYNYINYVLNLLEERNNIKYTLHLIKDRGYGENISAIVKWGDFDPIKQKYPFYSVHICKADKYKGKSGNKDFLKNSELIAEVEVKIKDYINKKYPLIISTLDGEMLELSIE